MVTSRCYSAVMPYSERSKMRRFVLRIIMKRVKLVNVDVIYVSLLLDIRCKFVSSMKFKVQLIYSDEI